MIEILNEVTKVDFDRRPEDENRIVDYANALKERLGVELIFHYDNGFLRFCVSEVHNITNGIRFFVRNNRLSMFYAGSSKVKISKEVNDAWVLGSRYIKVINELVGSYNTTIDELMKADASCTWDEIFRLEADCEEWKRLTEGLL